VMFYEFLTGQRPFQADRLEVLLKMHMVNDPPPIAGPISRYEGLIARMMAKAPQNRPTAAQVVQMLNDLEK
jgi:eukaryotic-like serine/threonine-protein kinase